MTDRGMIALVIAGLALLAAGVGLRWTSLGWRAPLAGAVALVAVATVVVMLVEVRRRDAQTLTMLALQAATIAACVWAASTTSRASAWFLAICAALQALLLIALLLLLTLFRLKRLF